MRRIDECRTAFEANEWLVLDHDFDQLHRQDGARISFLNTDARPHAMSSDPIQVHTDCPAITDVGRLNPGQRGTTGVLDREADLWIS